MKKAIAIPMLAFMALLCFLLPAIRPAAAAGETAEAEDCSEFYSTEQGKNNWFYLFGSPHKYALMTWGESPEHAVPHWCGPFSESWCGVFEDKHFNSGPRIGSMACWVADRDGTVTLTGNVNRPWQGGDGLYAGIYKNEEPLWEYHFGADIETQLLEDKIENVPVKQGDCIFYYTESGGRYNNGYDAVLFNVTFSFKGSGEKLDADAVRASLVNLTDSLTEVMGVTHAEHTPEQHFTAGEGETEGGCASSVGLGGCIAGLAAASAASAVLIKRRKKQ